MPVHLLERRTIISAPVEECWRFFSDPRNLARLTPSNLGFEISSELPEQIRAGLLIRYRVRPLFGIPMTWVTEITEVQEGVTFTDEQRAGPYRRWHHEHHFRALSDGRTEMRDAVEYVLPFGWAGELFHPLLVVPRLQAIFAFREKAIAEVFRG